MKGRRRFIKTAGIGVAGIALAPWNNLIGEISRKNSMLNAEAGIDLTDSKNAKILEQWGYLNIVTYGADPTGSEDSTAAIQKAIDDGYNLGLGVLVPFGSYIISDTLRCYKWWTGGMPFVKKSHSLFGENRDGKRPLFKLAVSAPRFDDVDDPRPMIAYQLWQGSLPGGSWTKPSGGVIPQDEASFNPMKGLKDFIGAPPNTFDEHLINIDFDCSGHPGGVGVFFPAAQKSVIANVKVLAEGAHTGIHGIPGRNMGGINLEVYGGKYGLVMTSFEAGATVVGVTLVDQTERAFVSEDFVPSCVVGFHIKKKTAPVISVSSRPYDLYGGTEMMTAKGTMVFVDGMIEVGDKKENAVIDNKAGKGFYARNVYVKGPNNFIQSSSRPAVGGKGNWYQVNEYCYTDQKGADKDDPPYEPQDKLFRVFSVIDGVVGQDPEPSVVIKNNTKPPSDLIRKHLLKDIPQVSFSESTKTRNIMQSPYNAVADGRDNWEAIQTAIDETEKDGGGMVFVPKGTFLVSRTLTLRSKTKLIGLGPKRNAVDPLAVIGAHPSWVKSETNSALVQTVNDPDAETFLGFMNLLISPEVKYHINWRTGRKSSMMNLGFGGGGISEATVYITGNGGGKIYLLEPQSSSGTKTHRHIKIEGTSQPLSWYGCNLEAGSSVAANMEITDSRNLRIYGIKREGKSPTLIMKNCHNIGFYALGAMREGVIKGSGGHIQLSGNSDQILAAMVIAQMTYQPNDEPILTESYEGKAPVKVIYPDSISLYKRGEIDDKYMDIN